MLCRRIIMVKAKDIISIKDNIMEIIEDYEDLKTIERAVAEDDGVYYTFDEVLKDLGIDKNEL